MARKRYGKPLSLAQLQAVMSETIRHLSATIANEELSRELRLRACSAMAANTGVYRQLLETSDLDKRLAALEERMLRCG